MELVRVGQRRSERAAAASRDGDAPGGIEAVVAGLLRDAGMSRVLQYLNARTRYRFTSSRPCCATSACSTVRTRRSTARAP
jgi:hypothetical protein